GQLGPQHRGLHLDLDLAVAAVRQPDHVRGHAGGHPLGLRPGGLEQFVVGDRRGARGGRGGGGGEVAGELDALHVGVQIGDADLLSAVPGGGLVVLDADLDVVEGAAGDLGEEGEALDGHVGRGGEVLGGLQPVGGLALGEVHRDAVHDDEEPAEYHDDDEQYSQCAHAVFPPPRRVRRHSPTTGRPSSASVTRTG